MAAAIETRGLTKSFGSLVAVNRLDLVVDQGEVFGFLGPNGAGKTTTIRMLLDFLRPTAGSLSVLGGDVRNPALRKRIGYLPGDLKLDRRYSGNDIVDYFGHLRGGVDRALVEAIARRFDLDLSRPSGELSTGNRRKVGILQAFMHRPELLILDEPTAGLDPLLQNEFVGLVREAVAAGTTVFLSSHVLPEVEALAGRVAVLRQGQLVTIATIDELRQRARHRLRLLVDGEADERRFLAVPGVVSVAREGPAIDVVVEGSVDGVLKVAATMTVKRISTPGDDLAEMFMAFYGGEAAQ